VPIVERECAIPQRRVAHQDVQDLAARFMVSEAAMMMALFRDGFEPQRPVSESSSRHF
jgi:hypothetical protein